MIKENLRDMIDAGMAKIPADVAIYRSRIVATGECDAYIGDNTQIIDAVLPYCTASRHHHGHC